MSNQGAPQVYTETANKGYKITRAALRRHKNRNASTDPITQKYGSNPNEKRMRHESIEYFKMNLPKNELNHKTPIPQPDHTFSDGCFVNKNSPSRNEPKRKLLEKEIIGSSVNIGRPSCKRQFLSERQKNGNITNLNVEYAPYNPQRDSNGMEKSKRYLHTPAPKKDLLSDVPDKYRNMKKEPQPPSTVVEERTKRLFPDSYNQNTNNIQENKSTASRIQRRVGLNGKPHFKVPKSNATLDNVNGLFNYRKNDECDITPKEVHDDFHEFSNSAKLVCQEKMKYY